MGYASCFERNRERQDECNFGPLSKIGGPAGTPSNSGMCYDAPDGMDFAEFQRREKERLNDLELHERERLDEDRRLQRERDQMESRCDRVRALKKAIESVCVEVEAAGVAAVLREAKALIDRIDAIRSRRQIPSQCEDLFSLLGDLCPRANQLMECVSFPAEQLAKLLRAADSVLAERTEDHSRMRQRASSALASVQTLKDRVVELKFLRDAIELDLADTIGPELMAQPKRRGEQHG